MLPFRHHLVTSKTTKNIFFSFQLSTSIINRYCWKWLLICILYYAQHFSFFLSVCLSVCFESKIFCKSNWQITSLLSLYIVGVDLYPSKEQTYRQTDKSTNRKTRFPFLLSQKLIEQTTNTASNIDILNLISLVCSTCMNKLRNFNARNLHLILLANKWNFLSLTLETLNWKQYGNLELRPLCHWIKCIFEMNKFQNFNLMILMILMIIRILTLGTNFIS